MNKIRLMLGLTVALASPLTFAQTTCAAPDGGRLLASGCFQCHGTNGQSGGFDEIAGETQLELLKEFTEMRAKTPGKDIMDAHARGYTNEQLACIALYFSKQPKL